MSNEIKNGAYVSIGGKVGRVFSTKNGAAIEVHVQDEKQQYPDRYTVWGLGDQVAEGDRVEVHGWLSTSPESFTKRDGSEGHGVRRAVNAPKLAKHEAAAQSAPAQDEWASGGEPF